MKRKKVVITRDISVVCEDDAMTIKLDNPDAKTTRYYLESGKCTKSNCEVVIMTYLERIMRGELPNATVFVDERLANEFEAITNSPYLGEFKLVYTDKNGRPLRSAALAALKEHYTKVDTTPYHIEIKMFGDKTAFFQIRINDYFAHNRNFNTVFRTKEANEFFIRLYQRRHLYANLSITIPRYAACWLDFLAVNSRRVFDELNITLTEDTPKEQILATA